MNQKQISVLVVDDESAIREMIRFALDRAGMNVRCAADGLEALGKISDERPDILLLDWMMPGISGLELTRRLRRNSQTAEIPIIMLTARVTDDDKVAGFNAGTDDYIIKPFSPRELIARIQAVLRRASPGDVDGKIKMGQITIDSVSRRVFFNDETVQISPTEYRLLEFFMTHNSRSFSREQLLNHVWGTNSYLEERTVDVHIRRLRKSLAKANLDQYIQTVRGHGYRFMVDND